MTKQQFKALTVGSRILVRNLASNTNEWATTTSEPFDAGTMIAAKFDNLQQQKSGSGIYPAKTFSVYFRDVVQLGERQLDNLR